MAPGHQRNSGAAYQARERIEIGRLSEGQWDAGFHGDNAGNLPTVCEFADHPRGMEPVSQTNGKVVNPTSHKEVGNIPVGDVLLQTAIETVSYRIISDRAGKNGGVKY